MVSSTSPPYNNISSPFLILSSIIKTPLTWDPSHSAPSMQIGMKCQQHFLHQFGIRWVRNLLKFTTNYHHNLFNSKLASCSFPRFLFFHTLASSLTSIKFTKDHLVDIQRRGWKNYFLNISFFPLICTWLLHLRWIKHNQRILMRTEDATMWTWGPFMTPFWALVYIILLGVIKSGFYCRVF